MGRCNDILKEYLRNASLHGVRFLVDEEISSFERIFWFLCVTLSWIASGMLIMSSLDAYQNNAISFVVETSYRDWDTHFPSVVICESKNIDRVQEVAERYVTIQKMPRIFHEIKMKFSLQIVGTRS